MLKWLLLIAVFAVFVLWLKKGKKGHDISDPEALEVEQKRFYVTPPDKKDAPTEDDRGDSL